jgi:hypothetical protein
VVYRCKGEDGSVEFRQQACETGKQQQLQIDVAPVGWRPAKPKRTKVAAKARKKQSSRTLRTARAGSREKDCWRAEKRVERIHWTMRRGYKAGKGAELRRERRENEEYLRKFCRD